MAQSRNMGRRRQGNTTPQKNNDSLENEGNEYPVADSTRIMIIIGIKLFHYKQKLKQYMTTKSPLWKILKEVLHTEDKIKHNHKRMGSINLKRRTNKYRESSIELVAHTQILK
jgi:hypothetical protein